MAHKFWHDLASFCLVSQTLPTLSPPLPSTCFSTGTLDCPQHTPSLLPDIIFPVLPSPPTWSYPVVNSDSSLRFPLGTDIPISWDQCLSYAFFNVSSATYLLAVHSLPKLLRIMSYYLLYSQHLGCCMPHRKGSANICQITE